MRPNREERERHYREAEHWCSRCQKWLPLSRFTIPRKDRRHPGSYCRRCQTARQLEAYHRNRAKAISLLGGRCRRCGYAEFTSGLQCHHVDPSKKERSINDLMFRHNSPALVSELDQCVLLCASCHFAWHAGAWDGEFVKLEGLGWTLKRE